MRLLGNTSSLSTFRWDLIYLLAQLVSDDRPGVSDLAAPIQKRLAEIAARRASQEEAENGAITAGALLVKKDRRRDGILLEAGGVSRATFKEVYATLFGKYSPSETARLGVDAESAEVKRILGEMGKLPDKHPIRLAYEGDLAAAEAAVEKAVKLDSDAETTLALERSETLRFKMALDEDRLATHGQLVVLLKSKQEADAFFRPTKSAPGEEESKAAPATNGAGAPVVPPPVPATPPSGGVV
jgi:hypothetical protein